MGILITDKGEKIMECIDRRDLAIKFIEDELDNREVVELYNKHAERNYYSQIYPMDEGMIDDLIGTEGKSALEIRDSFDSEFSTCDDWMIMDDRYGTLTSFTDVDEYVTRSELVEDFYNSEWCGFVKDDFKDFIVQEFKDNEYPQDFIDWFESECDSSTEWDDTDDLIDLRRESQPLDENGDLIHKGDKVLWTDPETKNRIPYEVYEEPDVEMVKLWSEYGECEALPEECEIIRENKD